MSTKDLSKECLYDAVKTLVETDARHIHLGQQKLFTLFAVAFQYLLFTSTKEPGHYLIRLEDSFLAEKLAHKAKEDITRKFLTKLLLPRRLKYGPSTFHLDFFHPGSWAQTNILPKDKVKAALIVKNTTTNPLGPEIDEGPVQEFPANWYYTALRSFVPRTIIIAYGETFEDVTEVNFPFIKKEKEKAVDGVTLAEDLDLEADA